MLENLKEGDVVLFNVNHIEMVAVVIKDSDGKQWLLESVPSDGVKLIPFNDIDHIPFGFLEQIKAVYRPVCFKQPDILKTFKEIFVQEFFSAEHQQDWHKHLHSKSIKCGLFPEIEKPYSENDLRLDRCNTKIDRDNYSNAEFIEHLFTKAVPDFHLLSRDWGCISARTLIKSPNAFPIYGKDVDIHNNLMYSLQQCTTLSKLDKLEIAISYNESLRNVDTSLNFRDMSLIDFKKPFSNAKIKTYSRMLNIYKQTKLNDGNFADISPIEFKYTHSELGEIHCKLSTKEDVTFETSYTSLVEGQTYNVSYDSTGHIIEDKSDTEILDIVRLKETQEKAANIEQEQQKNIDNSWPFFRWLTKPLYTRKMNQAREQKENAQLEMRHQISLLKHSID